MPTATEPAVTTTATISPTEPTLPGSSRIVSISSTSTTAAQSSQRIRVRRRPVASRYSDHDRERRQQAQREREVGDPEQHRPRRVGQGQGDHVEVERAERRGQGAGPGGRLGHVRGGGDQGEGEQRRGDEPDEGERPPAAGGQPAVGVEHQHQRQHEEQPGAEALVDPEGHRRARQRRVGQGRVRQPGRGEPVDGPPDPEDAEHPAERCRRSWARTAAPPGEGQAGQPAGPAGLDRDRGAVRAGHLQVEHRRERRGGRGEQQEHRSRARAQRRRRHIEKRAVRSVPVSLGPRVPTGLGRQR